ncbi:MAG TPA: putative lipid II flippase FtsW [Pseudonocardiaceae bacterium]|nr:putative lipid II flippase FtsW [Pseudonocardiaceae bacterium]
MARIRAAFGPLTAWLGRPLASFHLVLAVFGLLTAIGLVMVASASPVESVQTGSTSVYALFKKQLAFALLGLLVFWLGMRVPLRRIRSVAGPTVVASIAVLVLVLSPLGHAVSGSGRWFAIGPISIQPVEVAKLGLALWGANVLVSKRAVLHQYRHLLVPVVPVALVMFTLVILQPDLGSTITLGVVLIALLWFVGAQLRLFAVILAGALAALAALAISAPYRLARVLSFLSPGVDTSGTAYQANQARYALADGGLFGQGLGMGSAKYEYLPNVHTDFIFALIGEELGFIGCVLVLGLFAMVAVVGMRIATRNIDPWNRLVASTLTTWLVAQAGINIGYVVGLLPVTGIPLPMISYGGSSLVVTMLVFGILANCARHEPEAVAALRNVGPGRVGGLLNLPAPEVYQPPVRRRPARPSTPPRAGGRPAAGRATGRAGAPAPAEERRRTARSAGTGDRRRAGQRAGAERWAPGRHGSGRAAGRPAEGGGR